MTQLPPMNILDDRGAAVPPLYRLSALLEGHRDDVRALGGDPSSRLFSGSRDGTARSWVRKGARGGTTGRWESERKWEEGHEGFVNAVNWLPGRGEHDSHGYLVTSGQDSLLQVYSLSPGASSQPVRTLLGHAHNVCALHCSKDGKRIASGSWDLTARVWSTDTWECEDVLMDHSAAVWDVLLLDSNPKLVLTAAADNLVRLFDGTQVRFVFKGHTGPARALAKLLPGDPLCALFASASNDGTIRIWNYQSGDALTVLPGHDSFVYALISIPGSSGGGLASSGEDGIIKIWNEEDGEEDQQILVPALSVWSLAALPNGDLACGCSDNLIWIFTRDETRTADEATTREYETRLAKLESPRAPSSAVIPVAAPLNVHEPSVLEADGTKEGEIKLVEVGGAAHAYQWSASSWNHLGEVVGTDAPASSEPSRPAAPSSKMAYDGQEYDFVFQIDVRDEEPPLPLPFNLEDDPHHAATSFVTQHSLPESYVERIVEFIRASIA
ncbi:hypothetical protein JCM21900_001368 [Sporobolomyces salmonicolor]